MPTNCHPVLRACLTFILIAAALVAHAQTARAALRFVASKGYTVTITGSGTINGTSHDDVILGSALRDVINGNGGNDVVCACDGNHDITFGDGNDIADGSTGNDTIRGKGGDDKLLRRRWSRFTGGRRGE